MDNFDVIIVGAGLSGIGAAHHLQKRSPDRSYVILEGRDAIGGTWDLFRYPGIRSDSDMHTLGYAFKPWTQAKAIADGPSILEYVRETAREGDIDRHIRFNTKVVRADWDSDTARWTVETTTPDGPRTFTANFVLMCSGYYDYSGGHRPTWDGEDEFKGEIVHPQHWPESLDYTGKRVVVIGSGATAVTLVPAMTDKAAHVTMLQRSPSYVVARPGVDAMANTLRKRLPHMLAYQIIRWRNVLMGMLMFRVMRAKPQKWNKTFIDLVKGHMGPDYDVETHFTPKYNVWDQRLCLVPDSDLFEALKGGKADVVTDTIERFTATGIRLSSGKELAADVIVTATGLKLIPVGGMEMSVDGRMVHPGETLGYKGMMFSDVPNMAAVFGYTNASWTLKADLTSEYVCRLLNHMRRTRTDTVTPVGPSTPVEEQPWLDFSSGYVQRSLGLFPKQGDAAPWKLHQNYALDMMALRFGKLEDGALTFSKSDGAAVQAPVLQAA